MQAKIIISVLLVVVTHALAGCPSTAKSPIPEQQTASQTMVEVLEFKTFIVNLKENNRFLKAEVNAELARGISSRIPNAMRFAMRDSIIAILSANSYEKIRLPDTKTRLKLEIQRVLESHLGKGSVRQVYFVKFISQ